MDDSQMTLKEKLAKRIARELFAAGDEKNSPAKRIQFKGGKWPHDEKDQGGMVEAAVESLVLRVLSQEDIK